MIDYGLNEVNKMMDSDFEARHSNIIALEEQLLKNECYDAYIAQKVNEVDEVELLEAIRDGALGKNKKLYKAYQDMKMGNSLDFQGVMTEWLTDYFTDLYPEE